SQGDDLFRLIPHWNETRISGSFLDWNMLLWPSAFSGQQSAKAALRLHRLLISVLVLVRSSIQEEFL
ncbi:MAG: hypothetical protein ABSD20_12655, partial [Terriglobales bacterium]